MEQIEFIYHNIKILIVSGRVLKQSYLHNNMDADCTQCICVVIIFWRGRFIKISKILYKIIEIKTKENAV